MSKLALALIGLSLNSLASVWMVGHSFKEIDTCYHWNEKWQLEAKIDYAEKNNGDLYFHQGSTIYCWRTPMGAQSSWEDHGDYLIRIKFRPGTQIKHMTRQLTIDATQQYGDAIYSNDNSWHEYTITPSAVESWSAYQPNMIAELKADYNYHLDKKATDDNVFYPWKRYSLNWIKRTMPSIIDVHEKNQYKAVIYGENLEEHFKTRFQLPYRDYLADGHGEDFTPKIPTKIKIVSASYGLNIDPAGVDNALDPAGKFCDGKRSCEYKVHPKFIGHDPDPEAQKSFEISWKCSDESETHSISAAAPTYNKLLDIKCETFEAL